MKNLALLFFVICISILANAQISPSMLEGEWVEVGSEMRDGSRKNSLYKSEIYQLKLNFIQNRMQISPLSVFPTNSEEFIYTIKGTRQLATTQMIYDVDELTDKTLILTETGMGIEDKDLVRHFFVRKNLIDERKKAESKDDVLIAEEYFSPTMNRFIENPNLQRRISKTPYRVKGNYVIDLIEEEAFVYLDNISLGKGKRDEREHNLLTEIMYVPFSDWNLEGFENYSTIEIPFVIDNRKGDNIRTVFFTENTSVFDENFYPPPPKDIETAYALYQSGIEAFSKDRFSEAIKLFTDSFALYPENLDALYNKAVVYFHTKDMTNACLVWKQLQDLGQVKAQKLIEEHCN